MTDILPDPPTPASIRWRDYEPAIATESNSLRRDIASRGAHRWMLTVVYPIMKRETAAPALAFLRTRRGQLNPFWVVPAGTHEPMGTAGGTPVVDALTAAGARSVPTRGWTAGATLLAGDMVRFYGHTKAYMITEDVTADGSGDAALPIEPFLHAPVNVGEAVRVRDVGFYGRLLDDALEYTFEPGGFVTEFSFVFIEDPRSGIVFPGDVDSYAIDINTAGDDLLINAGGDRLLWR